MESDWAFRLKILFVWIGQLFLSYQESFFNFWIIFEILLIFILLEKNFQFQLKYEMKIFHSTSTGALKIKNRNVTQTWSCF